MEQGELCRDLLQGLISSELTFGTRLLTEPELAQKLQVSRMKIHRALDVLRRKQLIYSRPGAGTFLLDAPPFFKLKQLRAFYLKKTALLYADPPDNIHWSLQTVYELKSRLEKYGFQTGLFPFSIGKRKRNTNLAEVISKIPEEEFGSVVLMHTYTLQLTDKAPLLRSKPFRYFLLNYAGTSHPLPLPGAHQVVYDHYGDGFILGDILGRAGCRHIIMIGSRSFMQWSADRCNGVQDALHLSFPTLEIPCLPSEARSVGVVRNFIRRNGPDTVVICANCDFAMGTTAILAREKFVCGKDYKLIAFADNPLYQDRKLTAMALPSHQAALQLAELVRKTQGNPDAPGHLSVSLNSELKLRNSFRLA